jgi:hypothetical protein
MSLKKKVAHPPEDDLLELALRILSVETELRVRGQLSGLLAERWRSEFGQVIDKADAWASDKPLTMMREKGASASDGFSHVLSLASELSR